MTIKRLNYFTGQFLEAADFQAEQDYHIDMRRRGNRALYFSAGILDGFVVTQTKDPSTQEIIDPTEIVISRGIGIDIEGKELVITEPMTVKLPSQTTSAVFVTLSYKAEPTDRKNVEDTVIIDDVPTTTIINDATRLQEEPDVKFEARASANAIVIAKITIDTTGKLIGSIELGVRQLANVRFPCDVIVGQGGNNGVLKTRYINGKSSGSGPAGDDNDDLYLNSYTGKNVYLGFGGGMAKSSLFVSGNAGIGTRKPNATLEVFGDGGSSIDLIVNGCLQSNNNEGGLWVASDRFVGGHSIDKIGFRNGNAWRLTVQKDGNVGIGTSAPKSKLSVVGTDATEIGGAAQSSTFRISAGKLGTAVGSGLSLASIGFHFGNDINPSPFNNTSLGIRAYRLDTGENWETAAIGFGVDVDVNGVPQNKGASLWLHPNLARVGICINNPQATLHVNGDALIAGVTTLGGINPPSNLGFKNTLTAANIVKAWGLIQTGPTLQVLEGFNIESVLHVGSTGKVQINLKEKISGVICMTGNAYIQGGFVNLTHDGQGTIVASGTIIRPGANPVADYIRWDIEQQRFSIIVMGKQI